MKRLAMLLWSVDTGRPELAAAPFVYAAAAAALGAEVEMHFAGRAVRLLVAGVADQPVGAAGERRLYDHMRDAAQGGARFLACSMAWAAHVAADEAVIAEFAGQAGATAFVARSLDPDWHTLVF